MIDEMVDLQKEEWKALASRLYHPVRSNFVHDGDFAGSEDIGGFICIMDGGDRTRRGRP